MQQRSWPTGAAAIAWCVALALGGCNRHPAAAAATADVSGTAAATRAASELAEQLVGPSVGAPVILDIDTKGATFLGAPRPAPGATDGPLRYDLVWPVETGKAPPWPSDQPVRDARWAGDGAAWIVGGHGVLYLVEPTGRRARRHKGVEAGLAVAPDDGWVAVVAGEAPELELYRVDRAGGPARPLCEDMAPAWSPAVSADGAQVAFVSARFGRPELWVVPSGGGEPRRWSTSRREAPLPMDRTPYLFDRHTLWLHREGAVGAWSAAGSAKGRWPGAGLLRWGADGDATVLVPAGGAVTLPVQGP